MAAGVRGELANLLTNASLENADESGPGSGQTGPYGTQRIIFSVRTSSKVIGLTFDDGPYPEFTPKVLSILKEYGVTATFNAIGYNAIHHADLLREVVAQGHEVGNHTWSHLDLSTLDEMQTADELHRGRDAIKQVTGQAPQFFRPPRGELNGTAVRVAAEDRNDVLMWSITGSLPGYERTERVDRFVLSKLQPGAIIDYHDGIGRGYLDPTSAYAENLRQRRSAEVRGLPSVLESGMSQGYRFMKVSDLLTYEESPGTGSSASGATPSATEAAQISGR